MDKKKTLLNILTAVFFKVIILVIMLVSRRYLIKFIGSEANGLYALYISIIGFLAVAELGVGTAITFSMYKPIVDNDTNTVSALYHLYKKVYFVIALIVLVVGLLVTPFVPYMAKESSGNINIYRTYLLFLIATVVTYFFAAKLSLISAYKDNFINTLIVSFGQIIQVIVQIVVLIMTKSFELFLAAIILSSLLQWLATELVYKYRYKNRINDYKVIGKELKTDIMQKTKAMLYHKIGGLLVTTMSSIIISTFISVIVLGEYSNYMTIVNGIIAMITLVFSSLTAIIGHSFAKNTKEVVHSQFTKLYLVNFIIAMIIFLGFLAVSDELISIIFKPELVLDRQIVIGLTINYFIQFMRQTTLTFRDASGTFYNDRYKPLVEGVVNLGLAIWFIHIWGVLGVLIANIITNLFICHIIEPYVLYKYAFNKKPLRYYIFNYALIAIFSITVCIFEGINLPVFSNIYIDFIVRGLISVGISFATITMCYILSKTFRKILNELVSSVLNFIFKKRESSLF